MYVDAATVAGWEGRYGRPVVCHRTLAISQREMDMVLGSRKHGRMHDVTMFIFNGERLALILH